MRTNPITPGWLLKRQLADVATRLYAAGGGLREHGMVKAADAFFYFAQSVGHIRREVPANPITKQPTKKAKNTMKKTLSIITIAAACIAMTGCVAQAVPRLKLDVNMKTGAVALQNPKDTTIKNYKTTISKDGAVSVSFDSLTTIMNPDVITTTGEAQAKLITATAAGVADAIKVAKP